MHSIYESLSYLLMALQIKTGECTFSVVLRVRVLHTLPDWVKNAKIVLYCKFIDYTERIKSYDIQSIKYNVSHECSKQNTNNTKKK